MSGRVLTGVVTSNACTKTITVKVERLVAHPLYRKYIRRSRKYTVHDENNECSVGDQVTIRECPRRSKRKSWEVVTS
jgi:small subunit ribosomal protein S17